MKFFFFKDTLKKTAAIIVLSAGTLLMFVAIFGVVTGYDKGNSEDIRIGYITGGLSLTLLIPGIKLYLSGVKLSKLEEKLKQLAALVKTYRRISLSEIADKLGVKTDEAEKLLNMAVDLDLVNGHMDRGTGEFFIQGSLNDIKNLSFCPNCGSSMDRVVHKGETAKCPSCGSLFQ